MANAYKKVIVTGIVGGFLGGAVKIGWEALFPPRTPKREEEPPPMTMLNQLHLPDSIKNATYHYNGNDIPLTVMGVHFGFSIANALFYAVLAEKYPKVTCLRGSIFGIVVNVAFHEYLLPMLKLTPKVKDLPKEERLSELFGHIVWMNTIDYVHDATK
ncbi:DUF1440 domain-containing protein [Staphylococcus simiae]|uniref:DUF1440 domain-containing protein n=1 Tax=Staphylococcus simiae TaxID=308354 RepID=UPI001A971B96|nr:DUF1440 domain-containing protein [Staphylococcus simiae]MBO1198544.1 DUF1440 domain-containing protein [Staphylococcus simiae]MBO1200658.1 DUF1440 domain-containing protein [Staphylococcus simiae]MBO1202950.1 DUF1440 domain-containing protein [Staphylococcus simiae]MBO1210535.1 DUF1440 domain-containing protein [Staphylococcus simiae]MBO1229016.1 DUF1440 domain-containing protein [Staphylococcus simiae]